MDELFNKHENEIKLLNNKLSDLENNINNRFNNEIIENYNNMKEEKEIKDESIIKKNNYIRIQDIDNGIYLYLKYIHNKYYCNEIKYILGTINNKISYINDKNKKQKQNKYFYEREIIIKKQQKQFIHLFKFQIHLI